MATLSFKVSEDEARLIKARARKEGVTVSEYLRRRARLPAPDSGTVDRIRCPDTGAMIFAALDDQPPLTTEVVRELLADFP